VQRSRKVNCEAHAGLWLSCYGSLERLVDQLPAAQATALRLTFMEGLSLRAAAERLQISPMAVQGAQKKAIAALRQRLQPCRAV
jgi:RNA polymerase sigma factor (sigma-70 family)